MKHFTCLLIAIYLLNTANGQNVAINTDGSAANISAMAQRHVQYGVRRGHYRLVGNALLWTLKQGLGNDWTPELESAWTKCYALLSEAMILASEDAHQGKIKSGPK